MDKKLEATLDRLREIAIKAEYQELLAEQRAERIERFAIAALPAVLRNQVEFSGAAKPSDVAAQAVAYARALEAELYGDPVDKNV